MSKIIRNSYIAFIVAVLPAVATAQTVEITNPLAADNVTEFLALIMDVITTLSVPVIALAIIISGFLFVTAGGNSEQIDKAKRSALYVAIGTGVILGAELIVTILENTASGLGVGGLD